MTRRIAVLWFEHLALERFIRHRSTAHPFALTVHHKNAQRIYALNDAAKQLGLSVGMGFGDAHALCPELQSAPANLRKDQKFLKVLARLAQRYCPWVGIDGDDVLVLDMTGSSHLWGGEGGFIKRAKADFAHLGLSVKISIAPTLGAAWALAHYSQECTDDPREALRKLPISALRIDEENNVLAGRLGLHKIGDLYEKPRAEMARRFGQDFLLRLDQALGEQFENISPIASPRGFATRMNFPEPIGLYDDVMAALERLLEPLCDKLLQHHLGAASINITMCLTDGKTQNLPLRFARPMRIAKEMLPLTGRHIENVDVGFGIDQIRIEAKDLIHLAPEQMTSQMGAAQSKLEDLLTRIGNRIGFENILRLAPQNTHIPEKALKFAPFDQALKDFERPNQTRPIVLFPPERLASHGLEVPKTFTWRRMKFRTARAIGPERIAPEWWVKHEGWESGVRDYWRVSTYEGNRLWLFYTPQNPAWYVQGEFA